jgi:Predicted ester cyclase
LKTYIFVLLCAGLLFISGFSSFTAIHFKPNKPRIQAKEIVRNFLLIVRSGKNPERAKEFMEDTVAAHQVNSEKEVTIYRTISDYVSHVQDFKNQFGEYNFEITELLYENDKVYARWKQTGKHISNTGNYTATGLPVTEIGSAVYRIENGKIKEYWIQLDRLGFELQLKANQAKSINNKGD